MTLQPSLPRHVGVADNFVYLETKILTLKYNTIIFHARLTIWCRSVDVSIILWIGLLVYERKLLLKMEKRWAVQWYWHGPGNQYLAVRKVLHTVPASGSRGRVIPPFRWKYQQEKINEKRKQWVTRCCQLSFNTVRGARIKKNEEKKEVLLL